MCRDDCHKTRGYCEYPGECRCRLGWAGPACRDCQVLPGCVHGTCSKPLECRCMPGFTGILCQARQFNFYSLQKPFFNKIFIFQQFVQQNVTESVATVRSLESVVVKSVGRVKIVQNVIHIQVVRMEHVKGHGNAIVKQVGVECSAMKN